MPCPFSSDAYICSAVLDATASAVSASAVTLAVAGTTTMTQEAISKNYENVTKS